MHVCPAGAPKVEATPASGKVVRTFYPCRQLLQYGARYPLLSRHLSQGSVRRQSFFLLRLRSTFHLLSSGSGCFAGVFSTTI